ncbi:carbohydrate-selective porin [Nostoc sp. PCC 7524]|uniref:iron uptake porin n=1 Tax=Nostoc sp. (strain ATCC 29411 / PCC 7524) TaxID=28072 RepID=UPI00029EF8AC|nr:iron uptake porin [Nostoc sp. PCC 7524]AFY46372.1 carbohydrate-selective porin [Nostoc sp. PCC 7524]
MSNLLWKSLVVSPAVLGATLLVSSTAIAAPTTATEVPTTEVATTETAFPEIAQQPEVVAQAAPTTEDTKVIDQVNRYSTEGRNNTSLSQVTSVSQFSDVQPTDWAFQALQSLVERYGCIAGYPNGTYRGNRALTRYEFAAGLNACLDRVNELIATATADLVTKEDLATLQRLQEEFSAELATLRGRVDALEARTAELEANQFSTTTKLAGEAIFAVSDVFGDQVGDNNNTVFQNRVRLSLNTSFTGRDLLTTRLAAGNANNFNLGNDRAVGPALAQSGEGLQTFNVGNTGNNNVEIDRLTYEAPFGPARVYLAASGGQHSHYAAVNNPYFFDKTDGGNGALSTFASESPIYRIGGGSGIAFNLPFGSGGSILRPSSLTVGYLASEANDPGAGSGVFNGNYAALGQLNFSVGDRLALAATYVHGYHGAGSAIFNSGSDANVLNPASARPVVGTTTANYGGINSATLETSAFATNSYGLSAAFRPSDRISVSGFVSYTDVSGFGANDSSEVWSYGAGIALPDFGKRGNVLGIFAGAQPYARGREAGLNKVPYQVEGFYKYRVSDNISITPGIIWLTNPGQNGNADDAIIGTLRTTFTF